jgi:hypothetical protein
MLRSSVCSSEAGLSPHTHELKELVDDLELSLDVNKSLFTDIISSKKAKSQQSSEETQTQLLISSKSLEIVQSENHRIQEALTRMNCEIAHANTLISISEERALQSRKRRKDLHNKHSAELIGLKTQLHKKEEEIRKIEKYASTLEDLLSKSLKKETLNPADIISEGKKVISKVSKQLIEAEVLKNVEEKKCRDLELELKKIQNSVKVANPAVTLTTDQILKKNFLLDLNFENFWFVGSAMLDDNSESIRSSDSSVQDLQFPNKFEFSSKPKIKVPKLNFPGSPQKQSKNESPEVKLNRLELAYQIKCEEIQSLQRVLTDLQAIEMTLSKSIDPGSFSNS